MANVINNILINEIPIKGITGNDKKTIWVSYESDFENPRITITCTGYTSSGVSGTTSFTRPAYRSTSPSEIYPCNFTYKGITYNAVGRCSAVGLSNMSSASAGMHKCFVNLYDGNSTTAAHSITLGYSESKNTSPGFTYFIYCNAGWGANDSQRDGTVYRFSTPSISSGFATTANLSYFNQINCIKNQPFETTIPGTTAKVVSRTCDAEWITNTEWQNNLSELGVVDTNYLSTFVDSNGNILDSAPICYIDGPHYPSNGDSGNGRINIYFNYKRTFVITFNPNGGVCDTTTLEVLSGDNIGELPVPNKNKYRFLGWFTSISESDQITSEYIPTNDITLYAHWELLSYTITLDADGGEVTPTVIIKNHGETIGDLPIPIKSGYNFLGWYENDELVDVEKVVTSNISLIAKYDIDKFTVNFISNVDGVIIPPQQVEYNNLANQPSISNYGYELNGWYSDSEFQNIYNFNTPITEDITLYAKWSPKSIIVILDPNGGECEPTEIEVEFNNPYSNLPIPTYEGFIFLEWKYNDEIISPDSICTIAENHTLVAQWDIKKYTINYITNIPGIEISPQIVDYGTIISLPSLDNTGYELNGWYEDSEFTTLFNSQSSITSNLTLYAKWTPIEITVYFDPVGGECDIIEKKLEYGMIYGTLPTPTKSKQMFLGWEYSGQIILPTTICQIPKNHTLIAKWTRRCIGFYKEIPFYDIYIGDRQGKQLNKGDLPIIIIDR